MERLGRCVIAVSEGIHDARAQPIAAKLARRMEQDAHGNVQLSGSGALADLLCELSRQARHQARARRHLRLSAAQLHRLRLGRRPARGARGRREGGAVRDVGRPRRLGSDPAHRFLLRRLRLVPLEAVAGKTRVMRRAFISASGTDITDAFRLYLRPLLGSACPTPTACGSRPFRSW